MSEKFKNHRGLITAAITFFVIELAIVLFRYHAYYHTDTSFDLGIFNQVFWNGHQGRFFQSSLSSSLSVSVETPFVSYHRLGQHFTPALLLWLPIYLLFPYAPMLLFLNVTLITVAGIVLYILARQRLEPNLATWITISYYCANAVIGPTLGHFQDFCQFPLFTFGLFLALEKRHWWWFGICAVLIVAIREEAAVVLFSIGFYLILSKRFPWLGLGVCLASLVYAIVVTTYIMPLFSHDVSSRFLIEEFGQYVEGEQTSSLDVLWGILKNPWRLFLELLTPFSPTLTYILGQFIPLGFISVISGATWMLIAFPLLTILLRKSEWALSLDLRYSLTLVPGIFYGAILWWFYHPEAQKNRFFKRFWAVCLSLSLILTITSSPNDALAFIIPNSFQPWLYFSPVQQWNHARIIEKLIAQIPPDASVSASPDIVPHLSSRREILRAPNVELINDAGQKIWLDYMIIDFRKNQRFQVISSGDRRILAKDVPTVEAFLDKNEYGLIGYQDGVILLKRSTPDDPILLSQWQAFRQTL
ncbi:DUF2079 domain-containing protein [Chroococcus sp. FPU101]|uniref:DUF2079 domain-containing protein n=1 Tax=Chroococcus sp. FPU101 TaxID=1974212 RepID=UPI001A8DDA37|nr:DUF2079 domain-containing protein [Chroococcus sp. FPU101]GFE71083.1 hypothetical protein CFPU101_36930 [Chroococcus sp. FPU101]